MCDLDKKRPLSETPELAQMRALAETAFLMWVKRMPSEQLARMVGELSLRWSAEGHNVATVAGAIHAELGMKFEVDQMLDRIAAWENIHKCKYDPAQGKFVKLLVKSEDPAGKSHPKKKSVADLEKKLAELEEQVRLSEKRAALKRGWSTWINHSLRRPSGNLKIAKQDWRSG